MPVEWWQSEIGRIIWTFELESFKAHVCKPLGAMSNDGRNSVAPLESFNLAMAPRALSFHWVFSMPKGSFVLKFVL